MLHHWVHDLYLVLIFGLVQVHLHIRLFYKDSLHTTIVNILHTIGTRDARVDIYGGSPSVLKYRPEEFRSVHRSSAHARDMYQKSSDFHVDAG